MHFYRKTNEDASHFSRNQKIIDRFYSGSRVEIRMKGSNFLTERTWMGDWFRYVIKRDKIHCEGAYLWTLYIGK